MSSKFITNYVSKYLELFIKDFRRNQLDLQLFKGQVNLEKAALDEKVLEALFNIPLCLEVKEATLIKLRVNIPWSKLRKEPVRITIESINIVLFEPVELSSNAERRIPEDILVKIEELKRARARKKEGKQGRKLADHILENVSVCIENVSLCVDTRGPPGTTTPPSPLVLSFTNVVVDSANEVWDVLDTSQTPAKHRGNFVDVRKLVQIEAISAAIRDTKLRRVDSGFLSDSEAAVGNSTASPPLSARDLTFFNMPVELHCHLKRLAHSGVVTWVALELLVPEINVVWAYSHWEALMRATEGLLWCFDRINELEEQHHDGDDTVANYNSAASLPSIVDIEERNLLEALEELEEQQEEAEEQRINDDGLLGFDELVVDEAFSHVEINLNFGLIAVQLLKSNDLVEGDRRRTNTQGQCAFLSFKDRSPTARPILLPTFDSITATKSRGAASASSKNETIEIIDKVIDVRVEVSSITDGVIISADVIIRVCPLQIFFDRDGLDELKMFILEPLPQVPASRAKAAKRRQMKVKAEAAARFQTTPLSVSLLLSHVHLLVPPITGIVGSHWVALDAKNIFLAGGADANSREILRLRGGWGSIGTSLYVDEDDTYHMTKRKRANEPLNPAKKVVLVADFGGQAGCEVKNYELLIASPKDVKVEMTVAVDSLSLSLDEYTLSSLYQGHLAPLLSQLEDENSAIVASSSSVAGNSPLLGDHMAKVVSILSKQPLLRSVCIYKVQVKKVIVNLWGRGEIDLTNLSKSLAHLRRRGRERERERKKRKGKDDTGECGTTTEQVLSPRSGKSKRRRGKAEKEKERKEDFAIVLKSVDLIVQHKNGVCVAHVKTIPERVLLNLCDSGRGTGSERVHHRVSEAVAAIESAKSESNEAEKHSIALEVVGTKVQMSPFISKLLLEARERLEEKEREKVRELERQKLSGDIRSSERERIIREQEFEMLHEIRFPPSMIVMIAEPNRQLVVEAAAAGKKELQQLQKEKDKEARKYLKQAEKDEQERERVARELVEMKVLVAEQHQKFDALNHSLSQVEKARRRVELEKSEMQKEASAAWNAVKAPQGVVTSLRSVITSLSDENLALLQEREQEKKQVSVLRSMCTESEKRLIAVEKRGEQLRREIDRERERAEEAVEREKDREREVEHLQSELASASATVGKALAREREHEREIKELQAKVEQERSRVRELEGTIEELEAQREREKERFVDRKLSFLQVSKSTVDSKRHSRDAGASSGGQNDDESEFSYSWEDGEFDDEYEYESVESLEDDAERGEVKKKRKWRDRLKAKKLSGKAKLAKFKEKMKSKRGNK